MMPAAAQPGYNNQFYCIENSMMFEIQPTAESSAKLISAQLMLPLYRLSTPLEMTGSGAYPPKANSCRKLEKIRDHLHHPRSIRTHPRHPRSIHQSLTI
jgi:hypothetical protein